MASRSIERADPRAPLRASGRLLALVLLLCFCLALHSVASLRSAPSPWPRRFLAAVARVCGVVVETRGEPLGADVLFAANHISWLDIPILAGATGTRFVAHAAIAGWPLIGWLASLNDTVFVERTNRLGVGEQVGAVRDALADHRPVALFPEGTTSNGAGLLPFKPALFEVVSPPPRAIRVQPIRLDYGAAVGEIAWVGDEPAPDNAWRVLGRRGRFAVRVDALEPFDPLQFGDRKAIATEARRRILHAASARGGAAV